MSSLDECVSYMPKVLTAGDITTDQKAAIVSVFRILKKTDFNVAVGIAWASWSSASSVGSSQQTFGMMARRLGI
jgi:hypothetical protein